MVEEGYFLIVGAEAESIGIPPFQPRAFKASWLQQRFLAKRLHVAISDVLAKHGPRGAASILDLHSGALSVGKHFVNLYRYFGDKIQEVFTEEDFQLYRDVRRRIQQTIAQAFGISSSSMYLTKPTFFSRINSTEAKTTHDEYWHPHIDKQIKRFGVLV
ncbi:hypothetical protein UY3_19192 [Chelonia mydas]|uniref:Uncharacterized protein n=1 Tax=Chelonia mydas TaxID=8469 RepID=M7AM31_CHEMY|nr:hypothetical protein UY3_19192 [Chelonia mydas]